jgi:hypothetical protein
VTNLLDGGVAELDKATLAGLAVSLGGGPLLGGGVEEVVTPQLADHAGLVNAELHTPKQITSHTQFQKPKHCLAVRCYC